MLLFFNVAFIFSLSKIDLLFILFFSLFFDSSSAFNEFTSAWDNTNSSLNISTCCVNSLIFSFSLSFLFIILYFSFWIYELFCLLKSLLVLGILIDLFLLFLLLLLGKIFDVLIELLSYISKSKGIIFDESFSLILFSFKFLYFNNWEICSSWNLIFCSKSFILLLFSFELFLFFILLLLLFLLFNFSFFIFKFKKYNNFLKFKIKI